MNRKEGYLDRLHKHLIIFDGAMGTSLHAQNLSPADYGGDAYFGCNDHLNLSCPQAVKNVHNKYLEAGADVIETNTFRSNRITLREFGLSEQINEINFHAARIARACADAFSTPEKPRFVAGSLGPSGKLLSLANQTENEPQLNFDNISSIFHQQAAALLRGGVDLLLIETAQDILEIKAAVIGIQQAFKETGIDLPIQAQVTLDTNGRMLLGTDIQAVLTILEGMAVDVIGLNCSTGPEYMESALAYLSHSAKLPISCLPNAGMPINIDGEAIYPLSAEDFADQMADFVERFSLSAVGGCCGTTPAHIAALVKKVQDIQREPIKKSHVPALASSFYQFPLHQQPRPFLIGERLNTQGSRRFKRLMLENDFQGAIQIAKEQAYGGAHALDICTALTENDREAQRMDNLIALLANQIDLPIVIDSTDPVVLEAGLKAAPGRCLLNSVNLENGEEKARTILELAKTYHAAVIALTIDEHGMAKTARQKLAVALRIFRLAVDEFQLSPSALIFDPLTFTLASGSTETAAAAVETLNAIELIKSAMPGCLTVLGASNISFGLQKTAREILNSVFLFHAVASGLDLAIVNPNLMLPYPEIDEQARALAENLIFNRSDHALVDFIAYFENDEPSLKNSKLSQDAHSIEEKIAGHILIRERSGLENDLDKFIQESNGSSEHEKALTILNEILLPAMQTIGTQFGNGELILPFVLQSAEIMRAASDHLEQYLEKKGSTSKGTVILATVYGDVHDIGKNLTRTIIANNGYRVIDLGKQVPAETIVKETLASKADAVGLSALLVSTSQQMPLVVEKLQHQNASIPVLIGGAAVNQPFAERIAVDTKYAGGVHFCADAFDALELLDGCHAGPGDIAKSKKTAKPPSTSFAAQQEKKVTAIAYHPADIPAPPFLGSKTIEIPLDALFVHLNHSALYRIGWGAGKASGEKWERYQREFSFRLKEMRHWLKREPWIKAKAAFGYYACHSSGDALVIYPDGETKPGTQIRLTFPRQHASPYHCLSDYFVPAENNQTDLIAFQLVSLGHDAVNFVRQLNEGGDIVEAFYAHGLATQLTEAAAQYVHARIRTELNINKKRGKRYSWGYAPLPDLSQHAQIVKLLRADQTMDIQLTSAYQFIPEYSTAAMIVHHPQAVYFQIEEK